MDAVNPSYVRASIGSLRDELYELALELVRIPRATGEEAAAPAPPGGREHWDADPFDGRIHGDALRGRGTCDMKGGLAACCIGRVARILSLCAGLAFAWFLPARAETPSLDTLLERLSRTAMLFRDASLEFACTEKIWWRGTGSPGDVTFEYVFVHDDEEGFRDYRTMPFLGKRRKPPPEISPEDEGVKWYLRSAYLWIFVFRESRQDLHRYRILGEEEVLGIMAVKIEFEPIHPILPKVNDWYGVAWVDPALGQLLKVVAFEPDDYQTKRDFEEHTRSSSVDEVRADYSTITTIFNRQRNGLRFPGKVVLEHARYRWENRKENVKEKYVREDGHYILKQEPADIPNRNVLMRVEQTYRNYKFFSVRTSEDVHDFILQRGRYPRAR